MNLGENMMAAATEFVNSVIARDTVNGKCHLRFPTTGNHEHLAETLISLYAVYKKYVQHFVTPGTFAIIMRNHKGHIGACRSGCGCLMDGNYCLKKIHFRTMLPNLQACLEKIHSYGELKGLLTEGLAKELQKDLYVLRSKTGGDPVPGSHLVPAADPSPAQVPAQAPAQPAPEGEALVEVHAEAPVGTVQSPPRRYSPRCVLPGASTRSDEAEVARVTELLMDALDCIDASADSKLKIKHGIEGLKMVLRRSFVEHPRPANARLGKESIQVLRILAKRGPKFTKNLLHVHERLGRDDMEDM